MKKSIAKAVETKSPGKAFDDAILAGQLEGAHASPRSKPRDVRQFQRKAAKVSDRCRLRMTRRVHGVPTCCDMSVDHQVRRAKFEVSEGDHHSRILILDALKRHQFLHHDSMFAPGSCFIVGQMRTLKFAHEIIRTDDGKQRWGIDKTFNCGSFFLTSITLKVPFLRTHKTVGVLFLVHEHDGGKSTWNLFMGTLERLLKSFAKRAEIQKKLLVMDHEFDCIESSLFQPAQCVNHEVKGETAMPRSL